MLLSWAVPKGPALDPSVKRFATQVEDHPFDYGEFEGVIPEGYGAGIVMLWDKGTWEPEVDDVDAALKKGDLKFQLNGFKLKGSWVLVRTRGGPGGDRSNWLLIKHRDEWAGPIDVTEAFPDSVKSGGDFADILSQNNPEIWVSNRPARGGQAGDLFEKIVTRALGMRDEKRAAPAASSAEITETPPEEEDGRQEATERRQEDRDREEDAGEGGGEEDRPQPRQKDSARLITDHQERHRDTEKSSPSGAFGAGCGAAHDERARRSTRPCRVRSPRPAPRHGPPTADRRRAAHPPVFSVSLCLSSYLGSGGFSGARGV